MSAIALITGAIQEARDSFAAVLTDRSLSFDREAGFAVQILSATDYNMKVAQANRQSVIDAVTNVAAIGISLNPAKKQAYLVPRGGKICLDISYIGLLDLAIQSGSLRWGQAELVRENDAFKRNGFDKPPSHEFEEFSKDRGPIVGVYVVVKTADGDYLTTTMEIDEVYAIRDRSESWKKGQSGPWKSDAGEMIKKTVIKRAYKLWPKTERLEQAIHHLNTDGGEGINFNGGPVQVDRIDVKPMIAEAIATKTDADALAYWKANNGRLTKQPQDHARLKQAVLEHRARLKEKADTARTVDMPTASAQPASATAAPIDDPFVQAMDAAGEYTPE